ncbi:MAG: lysophospholipase [Cyanobacteria bacterium]|nr:lysophospholipase [Cyanobacteriota bacterium]
MRKEPCKHHSTNCLVLRSPNLFSTLSLSMSRNARALLNAFMIPLLLASQSIGIYSSTGAVYAANVKADNKGSIKLGGKKSSSRAKVKVRTSGTMQQAARARAKNSLQSRRRIPITVIKPIRLMIDVPCRAWVPETVQPKAVLLCIHALGLNSDAFEQFGEQMKEEGIGTFAIDVRGFGAWMKMEGQGKCDFDSCLQDIVKALRVLHKAYPEKPVFILGESMGGAIAMRVAAQNQDLIDGLISCVPSGDRFHKTKNQLRVALRLMTLQGNRQIDVGTKIMEDATEDPALRMQWKDDPLNRLKLTSKELRQFQQFMNDNHETAHLIDKTPVLFLVGLSDRLVKPAGTVELYNEITTKDKKLVTVTSAEHLIFEQKRLSPALKKIIVNWLLTRTR